MPIGARLHVTGTLERSPHGFAVRNGTGLTQIGYIRGARRLVGRHVEVQGRRAAFDEITCDRIWRHGEPPPAMSSLPQLEQVLAAIFIFYGLAASFATLLP